MNRAGTRIDVKPDTRALQSESMKRHTRWLVSLVCIAGCSWQHLPSNAVRTESDIVLELGNSIEHAAWNPNGHVVELEVYGERIDDDVAIKISKLSELRTLAIPGTMLTRTGLERLGSLSKLEVLSLADTATSDDDIAVLLRLRELGTLELSRTRITDDGIKQLLKFPKLRLLILSGTKVSRESVLEFKKANPECHVIKN